MLLVRELWLGAGGVVCGCPGGHRYCCPPCPGLSSSAPVHPRQQLPDQGELVGTEQGAPGKLRGEGGGGGLGGGGRQGGREEAQGQAQQAQQALGDIKMEGTHL